MWTRWLGDTYIINHFSVHIHYLPVYISVVCIYALVCSSSYFWATWLPSSTFQCHLPAPVRRRGGAVELPQLAISPAPFLVRPPPRPATCNYELPVHGVP